MELVDILFTYIIFRGTMHLDGRRGCREIYRVVPLSTRLLCVVPFATFCSLKRSESVPRRLFSGNANLSKFDSGKLNPRLSALLTFLIWHPEGNVERKSRPYFWIWPKQRRFKYNKRLAINRKCWASCYIESVKCLVNCSFLKGNVSRS